MKKRLLIVFVLFLFVNTVFSQPLKLKAHFGVSDFYNAATGNIRFSLTDVKDIFHLSSSIDLVLLKTQPDKQGFTHYRFYQTYEGIPVEKTMFIVHTKDGFIKSTTGNIITALGKPQQKNINILPARAIELAIAHVGAKQYAWQLKNMEAILKAQTKNAEASYYPQAKLVYYNEGNVLAPRSLKLCYKINVFATRPLSRAEYFIDAATGKFCGKKEKIQTGDATGIANTAYSGVQTIHSEQTGQGAFCLRDITKGNGIITLRGETNSVYGNDYTSNSANWNLQGNDLAALDAHFAVAATHAYYLNKFGRNSYDGQGSALISYVNDAADTDNAFWDGIAMHFCPRSDGKPGGTTAIDITGHELTHGVTQETCNLEYVNESGAINESLSDIMGKSIQFTAKPNDINWSIGNDMNLLIRNMANPNALGQPDTYKGLDWYNGTDDNGGVHTNSGVGNFMFYLLVNGGKGTNDRGDKYAVTGIGLGDADQVIYRTQTFYLTENAQYIDWRAAAITAATDLYGAISQQVTSVKNAFYAVGIGADSSGCNYPDNIVINNITKRTATVSWVASVISRNYTLQYKAITASAWKTIAGITSNSYNLTKLLPGVSYQVRIQTICTVNNASNFSDAATFTTEPAGPVYCNSHGLYTDYEYIERVGFNDRGYSSGNNNGYGNFISTGATLKAGKTDTISLTPGFTGEAFTENWKVYVDFNRDGDFDDANELAGLAASATVVKMPIKTPVDAPSGLTRARLQMSYDLLPGPCATFTFGEVEDYSVFITGSIQNTIQAPSGTPITISPNPVKGNSSIATINLVKQGGINLRITDLSGKTILIQPVPNTKAGENKILINSLDKLRNGAFMLTAEQGGIVIGHAQLLISR